jgi:hypothetical protein
LRELSVLFYPQKNHMKEHFFHPDTPSWHMSGYLIRC